MSATLTAEGRESAPAREPSKGLLDRFLGVFADVPRGTMGAIIDSQQQLALVVNQGSAADSLGLSVGKTVVLE